MTISVIKTAIKMAPASCLVLMPNATVNVLVMLHDLQPSLTLSIKTELAVDTKIPFIGMEISMKGRNLK